MIFIHGPSSIADLFVVVHPATATPSRPLMVIRTTLLCAFPLLVSDLPICIFDGFHIARAMMIVAVLRFNETTWFHHPR